MGMARKQQTFHFNETLPFPPHPMANNIVGRNLGKYQLGGVIFGCKNSTIKECFSKQLFGLPAQHFSYVKDIDPGLPLFLFNYSDRKLHGIFEATGKGQMYIDPYAWTTYYNETTKYPAQVKMRVRLQCQTLPEDKFAQVIVDNYFSSNHFLFELDHIQTNRLIFLLVSVAFAPGISVPQYQMNKRNVSEFLPSHGTLKRDEAFGMPEAKGKHFTQSRKRKDSNAMTFIERDNQPMKTLTIVKEENWDEKTLIYEKLKQIALSRVSENHSMQDIENGSPDHNNMCSMEKVDSSGTPFQDQYTKLIQEVQELMAFKTIQTQKNCYLEQKLMDATFEIQILKDKCTMLESKCNLPLALVKKIFTQPSSKLKLDPKESSFLIGKSNGESELASDLYCPSKNMIKYGTLMSATCSYSSPPVHLNDQLHGFGDVNGNIWYDKGESYNPIGEKWTLFSSLNSKTGGLAGVSFNNKKIVGGGSTGTSFFSDVGILDLDVGRWISTRPLIEKRFALVAMEFNGALYANGGYNGIDYIKFDEIFDHKEHYWTIISKMNTKRGCHPMIVLNGKLYALNGFNGSTKVPIIHEELDSYLKTWVMEEQINHPRVYFAASKVKERIYISLPKSTMVIYNNK